MQQFLSTYCDAIGMPPVSAITTIFGAFCVTFVIIICWGKLVEDFGPKGGMLCAAIIVGTFWVVNHKLPGFGINPEGLAASRRRREAIWVDLPGLQGRVAVGGHGHDDCHRTLVSWPVHG